MPELEKLSREVDDAATAMRGIVSVPIEGDFAFEKALRGVFSGDEITTPVSGIRSLSLPPLGELPKDDISRAKLWHSIEECRAIVAARIQRTTSEPVTIDHARQPEPATTAPKYGTDPILDNYLSGQWSDTGYRIPTGTEPRKKYTNDGEDIGVKGKQTRKRHEGHADRKERIRGGRGNKKRERTQNESIFG